MDGVFCMIDLDYVLDAINDVPHDLEKYVVGDHFTDQSSLSLADWARFLSFKGRQSKVIF